MVEPAKLHGAIDQEVAGADAEAVDRADCCQHETTCCRAEHRPGAPVLPVALPGDAARDGEAGLCRRPAREGAVPVGALLFRVGGH